MKNKKGVLGIDTVKGVIIALLIVAIMTLVMFLVVSNLRDSVETIDAGTHSGSKVNETLTSVDEHGEYLSVHDMRKVVCTAGIVTNVTDGVLINSANYTSSGCKITYNDVGNYKGYNNTNWYISYTYTYARSDSNDIYTNLTTGTTGFFTNVPTFFVLLGVIVLVLIISIVIIAVARFSPGLSMRTESSQEL